MDPQCEKNDRRGMAIGGVIVLGLGVVFLLSNLHIIPDVGTMWPLVLVIIGIALLVGAVLKKETKKNKEEGKLPTPE